jgi:hypothetical protein
MGHIKTVLRGKFIAMSAYIKGQHGTGTKTDMKTSGTE